MLFVLAILLSNRANGQSQIDLTNPSDAWSTWKLGSILMSDNRLLGDMVHSTDECQLVSAECVRYHNGPLAIFDNPNTYCYEMTTFPTATYQCVQSAKCNLRVCIWERTPKLQFQVGIFNPQSENSQRFLESKSEFNESQENLLIVANEVISITTLETMQMQTQDETKHKDSHAAVYLGVFLTLFFVLIAAVIVFLIYRYPHQFRQLRERITQPTRRPPLVRLETHEFPPDQCTEMSEDTQSVCSNATGFSEFRTIVKS